MPAADRWHQCRPADRRRSRSGVEADQDEAGDVPAYGPPGILVAHDLLGAPRGPQQARRFASRKPPFARFGPGRQRDRHDLRAKPLPSVVIDRPLADPRAHAWPRRQSPCAAAAQFDQVLLPSKAERSGDRHTLAQFAPFTSASVLSAHQASSVSTRCFVSSSRACRGATSVR